MKIFLLSIIINSLTLFDSDSVSISIIENSIHLENGKLKVKVALKNEGNIIWGLPAFRNFDLAAEEESFYCEHERVVGSKVFISDSRGNRIYPTFTFGRSDPNDPLTEKELIEVVQNQKDRMIKNTIILNPKSLKVVELELKFDLENYTSGKYTIFIIYGCGNSIFDFIDTDTILSESEDKNKIFQGCLKTETRIFIIE